MSKLAQRLRDKSPPPDSSPRNGRVRPSLLLKTVAATAFASKLTSPSTHPHNLQNSGDSANQPAYMRSTTSRLNTVSPSLASHQSEIARLQDKKALDRTAAAAAAKAVQSASAATSALNAAATPPLPADRGFNRSNSVAATPDAIRKERDRLLKEKAQWGEHVKRENAILMQLLHDTRHGKSLMQMEMDKLTEERHEIGSLKMEHVAHNFEKNLAHLPLGERGHSNQSESHSIETQHKADGVHAMMCSIARKARASQETAIQELLTSIADAEEFFLKGGDITLKIHELKDYVTGMSGMADHHHLGKASDKPTDMQDMPRGSGGAGTSPGENGSARGNSTGSSGSTFSSHRNQRQSTFGVNKGISFSTNSTAHVISAMSNQQKEMDVKLVELGEQRDHWKGEYEGLKRKMTKMKVINAITKISYASKARNGGGEGGAQKYDFVLPADTQGWDSLPENWKRVGLKCLQKWVKDKCNKHVRRDYVTTEGLAVIAIECSEHLKDILGHMMYTTATSAAGKGAPEEGIGHLCDAILNSLAMEREAYPLITMYLTYHGESMYVENREEEEGGEGGEEEREEDARVQEAREKVELRTGGGGARGDTRRVSTTAHHFSQPGGGAFAQTGPPPSSGAAAGSARGPPPAGSPRGPPLSGSPRGPPPAGSARGAPPASSPRGPPPASSPRGPAKSDSVGSNFSFDNPMGQAKSEPEQEGFSDSDSDGLN